MSHLSDKDGPDKDLPDEQQLDEYLRGGSDVSRQYRQLHSADVPAELDHLVLRQAREAVNARPVQARPAKSRAWMRWTGPLALAASAVLVVSIVIESGVHEDTYLSVPASAPAEVSAKQEAAEQPTAGNAAEKRMVAADEAPDKAVASDATVVHVLPVQPGAVPEMAIEVPPPPALAAAEPAPFHDRGIKPAAPPAPSVDEPPAESVRREQANVVVEVRARTAAPAPAQASVAPEVSLLEEDASVEEIAVTGVKQPRKTQTVGPRNTIAAPAYSAGDDAEPEDEPRHYSDPEQWLRDIRELRKENKHEEANREWRRFRYVFPNYQVAENDPARNTTR